MFGEFRENRLNLRQRMTQRCGTKADGPRRLGGEEMFQLLHGALLVKQARPNDERRNQPIERGAEFVQQPLIAPFRINQHVAAKVGQASCLSYQGRFI